MGKEETTKKGGWKSYMKGNKGLKYSLAGSGFHANLYEKKTQSIAEHVGQEYGQEMRLLVLQSKETTYQVPTLAANPSEQAKLMWGKDYDWYLKKTHEYEKDKAKVFAYILSQCDETMKNRLESLPGYAKVDEKNDVVTLLGMIKDAMYDSNDKKYPPLQAVKALQQLLRVTQSDDEALVAYYKRFQSLVEHAELCYGTLKPDKLAEKDPDYSGGKKAEKEAIMEQERGKMLACAFMEGTNKTMKSMMKDLEHDFALGQTKYPTTVEEALQVMTLYTDSNKSKSKKGQLKEEESPALSFAHCVRKGKCFKCGKQGHKRADCPGNNNNGDASGQESGEEQSERRVGWHGGEINNLNIGWTG
jgi:hypothetical protein